MFLPVLPTLPLSLRARGPRSWLLRSPWNWALGLAALLTAAAAWPLLGLWALVAAVLVLCGLAAGVLITRWQLGRELRRMLDDRWPSAGGPARTEPAEGAGLPKLLAPLADTLSLLLQRQQALFATQAEQLEALRRQAHSDAMTGLFNRRHFMALLDGLLACEEQPIEAGLLLLRVRDLQGMNQRVGHAGADRVLKSLSQVLLAYSDRIERCSAGRLAGGDFALLLPVKGLAEETAATLMQALRAPFARIDPLAGVDIGAVEISLPISAAQALALAETSLGCGRPASPPGAQDDAASRAAADRIADTSAWRERLARALVKGQVALAAYPVRTPDGRQLHLDCPLRVRLQVQGPMEPASRWLQLAHQTRMCPALDERAVQLALQAIADDGLPRCINLSAQSLAAKNFVAIVARHLAAAPQAACRLWIDLPEALAAAHPQQVREAARQWRPLGAMLGLEHAGEALARMPQLVDLGLDCVRIDSRFVNGLAGEAAGAARLHLQGLVRLVQAVGLQVTAEGVRSLDDLELLWQLGFDAATGPALMPEAELASASLAS